MIYKCPEGCTLPGSVAVSYTHLIKTYIKSVQKAKTTKDRTTVILPTITSLVRIMKNFYYVEREIGR